MYGICILYKRILEAFSFRDAKTKLAALTFREEASCATI